MRFNIISVAKMLGKFEYEILDNMTPADLALYIAHEEIVQNDAVRRDRLARQKQSRTGRRTK